MKTLTVLAILAGLTLLGLAKPAAAQAIPHVENLQRFTAEANYMSLAGYLRYQYFIENDVWITRVEAIQLVRSQNASAAASTVSP
jgi:hypothetical protein